MPRRHSYQADAARLRVEREALVTQLAESRRAMREMRDTMLLLADSVRRALPDQGDAIVRDAVQLAHKADSHAAAAASPVDAESRGAGIGQDDGHDNVASGTPAGHDNVASGTPAAASVVPSIAATAGSLDHAPPMYGASVASQDVEVSEHAHTSPRDAGALRVGDLDAPVALDPAVSARGVVVRFTERPIGLKLGPNRVSTGALSAYAACIKRVRRNGSAYKTGQVKELDVIAAVYGQSMRGLSYEAVKQCVQRVGSAVRHHRSGDVTFVRPTVQELAASGVTLQPRMAGSVDSSDGDTLSRASTSQLGASPVAIGKDAPREDPWHGVGSDGEAQHSPAHGGPDRGRGRRSSSSSRGSARQGQGDVTAEAAFGDRRDSPPDEGVAVHARLAPVLSDTAPEHGEPQDVDGGGTHDAQSNAGGSHSDGSAAASEGHGDADDAMVHRHKGYEPHRPRTESSLSRRSSGDRRGSSGDRRGSSGAGSSGDRRGSSGDRRGSSGDRRGSSGDRRGSSGDRRGSSGDRRGSSGDRRGSSGDRRGSSGGRRGSSGDRRGSNDRRSSQQSSRRSSRRTSSGSQRGASAGDGAGAGAGAGSNRRGSHRSAASDHDHDRRSSRASRSGSRAAGGSTVQGAELSEDDIDFVVNVVRNLSGVPLVKHVKGGWLSKSHKRVFWITREAGTRHLQLAYVAVCG